MAESDTAAQPVQNGSAQKTPQLKPLAQFIRDLSFENILSTKGASGEVKPEISVQVNLDAKKRNEEGHYEVVGKYTIRSKNRETEDTLFVLELEYGGIFSATNVADEQLHPFLLIEAPRLMFPYVRRIVADLTHDGGFPPLNLEPIDFVALYRQGLAQRAAAKKADEEGQTPPN